MSLDNEPKSTVAWTGNGVSSKVCALDKQAHFTWKKFNRLPNLVWNFSQNATILLSGSSLSVCVCVCPSVRGPPPPCETLNPMYWRVSSMLTSVLVDLLADAVFAKRPGEPGGRCDARQEDDGTQGCVLR